MAGNRDVIFLYHNLHIMRQIKTNDSKALSIKVCKHNREARSSAKQLRFNHQVFFKTQEKSAVIMMGIVIGLFLLCYGIYLRCTFVYIFSYGKKPCNDKEVKIPILVLNSAVNPLAYSFFKTDINKEIKKRICCAKLTKRNKVDSVTGNNSFSLENK